MPFCDLGPERETPDLGYQQTDHVSDGKNDNTCPHHQRFPRVLLHDALAGLVDLDIARARVSAPTSRLITRHVKTQNWRGLRVEHTGMV
jgi:hypothetical protein